MKPPGLRSQSSDTCSFPRKSGFSLPLPVSFLPVPTDPQPLPTALMHSYLVEWSKGQVSNRRTVGLWDCAGSTKWGKQIPSGLWSPFAECSVEDTIYIMDKRCSYQFFLSRWQWKFEMGAPGFHPGSTTGLWDPGTLLPF